ncbi:MAG: hypothetical protein IJV83_01200 [Clostridia bacterium]|nr:hypothetical protein [Clostridia bacterium]
MQTLLQQTQAYRLIKTEAEENRLSHAYLLLFNDARNLRFALKSFAKIIFSCDTGGSQEQKRRARLIDSESFSDCLCFPAADKKLTVEDAEKIKEESLLHPVESEKKVFLIADFSEANTQTQNKLLKLLEEPPKGVVFLLGASSVFPVLQTVLSRTKRLEILPFSSEQVAECLSRHYAEKYDSQTLALCAACADGIVGKAQDMLEDGYYKTLLSQAFDLALTPLFKLPVFIKTVGETKYKREFLSLLRLIFRDALFIKTQGKNAENYLLLRAEKQRLAQLSKEYSVSALLYAQEGISQAEKQVNFNAVFPQCIELLIANIREKNTK